MNQHLALLFVYALAQVGLGLWIGRRVKSAGDFFVAGRQLGPGLIFATFVAANVGAGSTVGAAGLGYRDGLAAWWWVGSAGLGSLVLALTVGPRMWSVARDWDLRTVGDYLDRRYHRGVRGLIAALLWAGTVAILAGQLIALSWVLNVVAGTPKWLGCLLGGAVATLYFAAGGLLTSAWVNLVQLVVMAVGFLLALPLAISRAGGLAAVIEGAAAVQPGYSSFIEGGRSGWVYLPLLAPAFVVSPGLLQKLYGARDALAVRRGILGNAVVLLLFAFVPPAYGIVARLLHPGLANPELALPTVLMLDVHPLVGSLGLAAVVSAEISTADAILFMLATSLSQDLYKRFLVRDASDAQVLRVARLAAFCGGALGVAVAITAPSVIGVLSIFYSVLSVSLFVPVVAGLYVQRVGTPEALSAIGAGVLGLLAAQASGAGPGLLSPPLVGLLLAVLACCATLLLRRSRA